jgi:hypothetical protein
MAFDRKGRSGMLRRNSCGLHRPLIAFLTAMLFFAAYVDARADSVCPIAHKAASLGVNIANLGLASLADGQLVDALDDTGARIGDVKGIDAVSLHVYPPSIRKSTVWRPAPVIFVSAMIVGANIENTLHRGRAH